MPNFPPAGNSDWLGNSKKYVAPNGNDNSSGNGWNTAKKTIYAGLKALIDSGGGKLHVADSSEMGGPVPGQGIWLRSDFVDGNFFPVPGYLHASVPICISFEGKSPGTGPFINTGVANFSGGGTYLAPVFSITNPAYPVRIENMQMSNALQFGGRIGVDFDRNTDASIRFINVSSATRTGTTTVFTLTLPAAFTVTQAQRTSNVVTLTLANPGMPWPPFRRYTEIELTSTDPNFASGNYVLTAVGNVQSVGLNSTWTLSYAESGSNVPNGPVSGSITFKSHGCAPGETLYLQSTDSHFKTAQYLVTSVTHNTVTVSDELAAGNTTQSNIGTIAHEERFNTGSNMVQIHNCTFAIDQFNGIAGHSIDIGHNQAIPPWISDCWVCGYGATPRSVEACCAVYVSGGTSNQGPTVSSVRIENTYGSNGEVFVNVAGGSSVVDVNRLQIEMINLLTNPILVVNGNDFTAVRADDVTSLDNAGDSQSIKLVGVPMSAAHITRSGYVNGSCVGGDTFLVPNSWGPDSIVPTPWQGLNGMRISTWADGRITGKHPGPARSFGPVQSRFKNIIGTSGTWDARSNTLTTGQLAPDGSSTAVKVDWSGSNYVTLFPQATDGNTWSSGGRFVIAAWINAPVNPGFSNEVFRFFSADVVVKESVSFVTPFYGTGWQFITGFWTVVSTAANPAIEIEHLMGNTTTSYIWGPSAHYVPPSVLDNDFYEYVGTLKHQASYLQPGMPGTMDGQKFVAHGGLATAKYYTVGGGAGQITIGSAAAKAIEVFDENGNSLGVLRPSAFTVN